MTGTHAEFRDSWNDVTMSTTSPNGCVFLRNHGDHDIAITIDDQWFHRAEEPSLTAEVERLLREAFVERMRTYRRHKEMVTGFEVTPIDASRNPHLETFKEKRDSLAVEGVSSDGLVKITSVGMTHFAVMIDAELWNRRDRLAVERGLGEAATDGVRDQFRKMHTLTVSYTHLTLPTKRIV